MHPQSPPVVAEILNFKKFWCRNIPDNFGAAPGAQGSTRNLKVAESARNSPDYSGPDSQTLNSVLNPEIADVVYYINKVK